MTKGDMHTESDFGSMTREHMRTESESDMVELFAAEDYAAALQQHRAYSEFKENVEEGTSFALPWETKASASAEWNAPSLCQQSVPGSLSLTEDETSSLHGERLAWAGGEDMYLDLCGRSRDLKSIAVQTESLSTTSQIVQTEGFSCERSERWQPPRIPGALVHPGYLDSRRSRRIPKAPLTKSPGPFCSSRSSEVTSSVHSSQSGSSGSGSRSVSSASSGTSESRTNSPPHAEDVQIVLGGGDEEGSWTRRYDSSWQYVSGGRDCVRLSDFNALPRDSSDQLTSFGSLVHLVANRQCRPCPYRQKNARCAKGPLCKYCHADHARTDRYRGPRKARRNGL